MGTRGAISRKFAHLPVYRHLCFDYKCHISILGWVLGSKKLCIILVVGEGMYV